MDSFACLFVSSLLLLLLLLLEIDPNEKSIFGTHSASPQKSHYTTLQCTWTSWRTYLDIIILCHWRLRHFAPPPIMLVPTDRIDPCRGVPVLYQSRRRQRNSQRRKAELASPPAELTSPPAELTSPPADWVVVMVDIVSLIVVLLLLSRVVSRLSGAFFCILSIKQIDKPLHYINIYYSIY